MEWIPAVVTLLAVVSLFWLPGLAVATAAGVGGLARVALAPVLTLGACGTSAVLADVLCVRWSLASAAAGVLVWCLAAAVLGRGSAWRARPADVPTSRSPVHGLPRVPRPVLSWLVAGVAVGALAQVVPTALAMPGPSAVLAAFDAVGHFNALELIRELGSASSWTVSAVNTLDSRPTGADGAAWHGVLALAPVVPDAFAVFNVGLVVPTALTWTTGIAFLAQVAFPARPRVWCWAAAASAAGIGLPLYVALRQEGLVPNGVALALVPALVGLVAARPALPPRRWLALVPLGAAGVALTHPNAFVSAALALTPWMVLGAGPAVRRIARRAPGRALLLLTGGVGGLAALVILTSGRMRGILGWPPDSPRPWWETVLRVASGDLTGKGWATGFAIVLAALAGAVLARRLPRARWLVLANAVLLATYVLAVSPIPVLTDVDRLWYGAPRRFAPVVAALLVPLAALALDTVPRWLVVTGRLVTSAPRHAPWAVAASVVLVSTVPAALGTAALVRTSYVGAPEVGMPAVADRAERAMLDRLGGTLDGERAVLGSPFSGAAHLYGLHRIPVVPRTSFTPEDTDLLYVRRHIDELGSNPALCGPLERLGVGYLYVDPVPSDTAPRALTIEAPPEGRARLLDTGGTASVYELTGC